MPQEPAATEAEAQCDVAALWELLTLGLQTGDKIRPSSTDRPVKLPRFKGRTYSPTGPVEGSSRGGRQGAAGHRPGSKRVTRGDGGPRHAAPLTNEAWIVCESARMRIVNWIRVARAQRAPTRAARAAETRRPGKLLDRLARVPLLCIDEMGYLTLRPEQSNIFFKLMEERYRRRASIITTNLDYDDWLNFLGNKHMVTALLSRLRHQCTTIRIDGPSLREPQG